MGDFGDAHALGELAREVFAPLGCARYGVRLRASSTYDELAAISLAAADVQGDGGVSPALMCKGTETFHLDELAGLSLAGTGGASGLQVEHDGAGAPLLVDADGVEAPVLISLTDENDVRGIAWVEPGEASDVVGVGIDLAVRGDFPFTDDMVRAYRRIFTEREWELIHAMAPNDLDLGATLLFSAKEAAFKSASQRIRQTFRECGSDPDAYACPYFELRDIETVPSAELADLPEGIALPDVEPAESPAATPTVLLKDRWTSRGVSCIGNAAEAFEFLGISHMETRFALVGPMVLCVAAALRLK